MHLLRREMKGAHHMNWVTALDLEGWSDTLDAKNQFPRLVRRLLHATVEQLTLVEFPAGEGVQREGWDGFVQTPAGNAFVPTGTSVWESGVTVKRKLKSKANEDFDKRSKNPLGLDQSQ